MSDMQSYDDQIAEIRRKAITTAAGWAPKPDSVRSGAWVAESEAALALLIKVRDALKLEADSSDYHRVSLIVDRFSGFVARRCHSATHRLDHTST